MQIEMSGQDQKNAVKIATANPMKIRVSRELALVEGEKNSWTMRRVRVRQSHFVTFGRKLCWPFGLLPNVACYQASGTMCGRLQSLFGKHPKLVKMSKVGLFSLRSKSLIEVTKVDQKVDQNLTKSWSKCAKCEKTCAQKHVRKLAKNHRTVKHAVQRAWLQKVVQNTIKTRLKSVTFWWRWGSAQ